MNISFAPYIILSLSPVAPVRPALNHSVLSRNVLLEYLHSTRLINELWPTALQKIPWICLADEKLHQHQRSALKRATLEKLIFDYAETLQKHTGKECLVISEEY